MSLLNIEFFKNKKILVTGCTGFKGAWLCQILVEFGAEVYGFALEPHTDPALFKTLDLERAIDYRVGDIRDFALLNKTIKECAPDIVLHLSAQAIVRESYDKPLHTYEVNTLGTVNILEAIRLNNVRAGVVITTDKVYKNPNRSVFFREGDPLGGYDPYSNSKACADLAVNSYIQSFFNPDGFGSKHNTLVASARAGNVIGGGDWAKDRLVPDLVRAFLVEQEAVTIRSPEAIRPWQHVLEPLAGYLRLAQVLFEGDTSKSGAWNFGPEKDGVRSVETMVQLFIKGLGEGAYVVQKDDAKHEDSVLMLDISKAKEELDWVPQLGVEETIEKTAAWYKNFYAGNFDMRQFTIQQVRDYFLG